MTVEELKQLLTEWASVKGYAEGNTEDAEGKAREAIELIDNLNQAAITFAGVITDLRATKRDTRGKCS